jgi:predicted nucleic acid-binding protein
MWIALAMPASLSGLRSVSHIRSLTDSVEVLLPDADDLAAASELALQLAHPLADCLYLALAERLGVALITADRAFARRAAPRSSLIQILEEASG